MLILAVLLALAAPASAGTVKYSADCSPRYYCTHAVNFTAAPGERNDVTVAWLSRYVIEIHDAGAPVRGCTAVDSNTARCTTGLGETEWAHVRFELGDGDDRALVENASVDGGPGNDTLTGKGGTLTGGPGVDVLTATGGVFFEDGDERGPDRYIGDPAAPAMLSYGRKRAVRIDLRRTDNGEDHYENVDSVRGGAGDDVLIGTDGKNTLMGGRGADRILGLGGDDKLYTDVDQGGLVESGRPAERDVVEGGAGDDDIVINEGDRAGNVLRCGAGRDTVSQAQRRDFVRGDCEVVWIGTTLHETRLRTRATRFLTDAEAGPHVARAGRQVIARGRRSLTLKTLGRRLLRERGRLRITVEVRDSDGLYGFRTELQRM